MLADNQRDASKQDGEIVCCPCRRVRCCGTSGARRSCPWTIGRVQALNSTRAETLLPEREGQLRIPIPLTYRSGGICMKIDRILLKNIGPHAELDVQLRAGLIGIIGPNGAGKSSLVNAAYAALTNDFSRFGADNRIGVITADSEGDSYVRLEGSHAGEPFCLTRWLRPNKSKLIYGGRTYSKAGEISEVVTGRLGVSAAVVDAYVFVNQWEMFSFLDQTPAKRAEAFRYLCGTESSAAIYKACTDYIGNFSGPGRWWTTGSRISSASTPRPGSWTRCRSV
jgi:energy-coupling factor transporter ATP-binding protein EcfA2